MALGSLIAAVLWLSFAAWRHGGNLRRIPVRILIMPAIAAPIAQLIIWLWAPV